MNRLTFFGLLAAAPLAPVIAPLPSNAKRLALKLEKENAIRRMHILKGQP